MCIFHFKPYRSIVYVLTSGSKEETHKPLIIGLAVGLSVGMILIIIIVVYYRRKRSSYQYNVFYDEQNIVMHPFDYSK